MSDKTETLMQIVPHRMGSTIDEIIPELQEIPATMRGVREYFENRYGYKFSEEEAASMTIEQYGSDSRLKWDKKFMIRIIEGKARPVIGYCNMPVSE